MGQLLINKVRYKGDNYSFESPELKGGVNILEAKNGHGKSTFMNLIYFGLSGKVDEFLLHNNNEAHEEVTKDRNNYVALDVTVNTKRYTLTRHINSNDIIVSSAEEIAKVHPIFRSKNEPKIFSDWILSELGIEAVEVFQGVHNFKINFKDLLRLVYHNQELSPKKIYKPADADNLISDSEVVRKLIFELLLGKTYAEYYSTLARFKEKEREKAIAKATLDEFIEMTKALKSKTDDLNLVFLTKKKQEKEEQLEKLYTYRQSLKSQVKPRKELDTGVNELKSRIVTTQLDISEKNRKKDDVLEELGKLRRLRDTVILEATQISKIIHSHETLHLFSADTCPYCLRDVKREKGHCVCGHEVAEAEYERFFYNSEEYADILKSKQKSVETIDLAISSCQEQAGKLQKEIEDLESEIQDQRNKIEKWVEDYDFTSNSQEIKSADDTILSVRTEINSLNQQIELEGKRQTLQNKFDSASSLLETIRTTLKTLEASAIADIKAKIDEFNGIYNEMMINTLPNCRKAVISYEDYMPILDDGAYKEASASVATRLLYYYTLLKLALDHTEVRFPRLLLIDTPETAGVDPENLVGAISRISTIAENHSDNEYQIILTTGEGKYPSQYADKVFLKLLGPDKLLIPTVSVSKEA